MSLKCAVVVTILLISAMSMAGCTGSPPAPVATVPGTPVPAGTAVPVVTSAVWTPETSATGHPYSKTYTFEATGDYVHTFTTTSNGTWIFRMTNPGNGYFLVRLQDNSGNEIEVLADGGGFSTGTKSVQLGPGTYYLDVAADAPWTITMSTA
jgi:hypothetical protein